MPSANSRFSCVCFVPACECTSRSPSTKQIPTTNRYRVRVRVRFTYRFSSSIISCRILSFALPTILMNAYIPPNPKIEQHAIPISIHDQACSSGNSETAFFELQKKLGSDHQNLTEANPEDYLSKERRSKKEGSGANKNAKVVVGYALTSKKVKSFLKPKLEVLARDKGIIFVAIDCNWPLVEQGPFHVILHKMSGKEWGSQLEEFKLKYPDVIVLDPPDAIQHVRNRQSMLQEVSQLKLRSCGGQVDVPRQLVVTGDPSTIPSIVAKSGLKLPLVVKPLIAESHSLFLAYDERCLAELHPPLVLQEFVNHGGVLFKVFVVGDSMRVVRRFSLPDVDSEVGNNGVMPFPRVSNAAATADNADLAPEIAELPPWELLNSLSKELRHRLGLRLFNMDIIREVGSHNHYYVIDINYFPGFGKMPDFEYVFIDFLLKLSLRTEKLCSGIPSLEDNVQHKTDK